MKKSIFKILLVLTVFMLGNYLSFGLSFGLISQENPFNATLWITILTPGAVWLGNWIITKFFPLIPNWAILGLVPLLGAGMDWLNNVISGGSNGVVVSVLASLGAVFLNELLKNWGARAKMSDKRKAYKAKKGIV